MGAIDTTIAEALAANRTRLFVGRSSELAAFDRLLPIETSLRVLFVHGPGGIGKTTLLHALEERARKAGFSIARCDARLTPADPLAVGSVLREHLHSATSTDARTLLMVDTFEEWAALEGWFRDQFLPGLSSRIRVVVAGRRAPGTRWRSDPGWHGVLEHRELTSLDSNECLEYLERRAISPTAFEQASRISRGHPLLLALIADACLATGDSRKVFDGATGENLLTEFTEHLLPRLEGPGERNALYLSCLLHYTTEPLLSDILHIDPERAADLFDWLAGLSFMDANAAGIFPHDVMRVALRAHLENRQPALRLELLDSAVPHYLDRLDRQSTPDPSLLMDNFYLFTGFMPPVFAESAMMAEPSFAEPAREADLPRLREFVGRLEGEESLALFDFWWREQPSATRVVRNSEGELRGFFTMLEIREPTPASLERDPLVAATWAERDALARPWRPAMDIALFLRGWLHFEAHMAASPVDVLWSLEIAGATLSNEDVALIAAVHPTTPDWLLNSTMYGHRLLDGSEHTLGDHGVVVTLHDFSDESTAQWFEHTYRRFRAEQPEPPRRRGIDPASLRGVLRNLHRPTRLVDHPLVARYSGPDPIAALLAAVEEECAMLRDNPASKELYRVLDRTYLRPALDQRAAAEACQLSWDQYRRRLTEAIKLLASRIAPPLP